MSVALRQAAIRRLLHRRQPPHTSTEVVSAEGCNRECKRGMNAGLLTTMSFSWGPGAGMWMLARRLTITLPEMTLAEAIATTRIHRVAGRTATEPS
jgi:hypothetical protein